MSLLLLAFLLSADITPQMQSAMDHISAQSLRGHLSFIASDLLEGRETPSRGLDIAAEYIAAQYRRAGLEPVGDDGYFQTASFVTVTPNTGGLEFILQADGSTVKANTASISLQEPVAL